MPAVHTDAVMELFAIAFRAYLLTGIVGHTLYTPQNTESLHKKPSPEYPTAGAGGADRACLDRCKRLGPVFSSVGKAQDSELSTPHSSCHNCDKTST